MKKIFLLGSTGSIGTNTLDVIRQNPQYFEVVALVAHKNTALLAQQITEFEPKFAVVTDPEAFKKLNTDQNFPNTKIIEGTSGVDLALEGVKPDIFLNAFVGFAGLRPTIKAIDMGLDIAIANKETLVVAGQIVTSSAKAKNVKLLPIDSEHSAIWQCLMGEEGNPVKRILLTASGGPFRTFSSADLKKVSLEQALKHPNWVMGAKITIDSATLMNKGLEVIEAFWLYDVNIDQIEVVVHPQSIIHSMVEFNDNSVKAQLGLPDMRIPIQLALTYPQRLPLDVQQMDFTRISELTFEQPDREKFPCLQLAFDAIKEGQTYPAALNAANEVAVAAFLDRKISFMDIPAVITDVLEKHSAMDAGDLNNIFEVDKITRVFAENLVAMKQNN